MMGVGHLNAARALMGSFNAAEAEGVSDFDGLKALVEQQNLIIQTLLVLLLEKQVITEQEFNDWAKKMDDLDGVRDGKLTEDKTQAPCPECGCMNAVTAVYCADCGRDLEPQFVQKP